MDSIFGSSKVPLPGERTPVFADRGEIEPDKDMASVQIVLPAPVVERLLAAVRRALPTMPCSIWRSATRRRSSGRPTSGAGSSSSRILTTPPVMAEGKVFAKDAQSTVSAFDADTGKLIWRVTLEPEKARDTDEFGGGLAYYGGKLFVTTGFASVFSLDAADGKTIWTSTVSAPVRGAPLVFGDRVFAISIDNKIQAMAAVDGSDLWQYTALQEVRRLRRRQQPGRFGRHMSWRPSAPANWSACASTMAGRSGTNR